MSDPNLPADEPVPVSGREARLLDEGSGRRRWPFVLLAVVLVVALALGGGWIWLQRQINPTGGVGDDVEVVVAEGTGTGEIADQLEAAGVVTNGTVFELYARFKGASSWQAGAYVLPTNAPMADVIARLDEGPGAPPFEEVTVPEGFSVFAAAGLPAPGPVITRLADPETGVARFDEQRLMELVLSGNLRSRYQPDDVDSIEGLLFPDTYRVEEDEDEAAVLAAMAQRFDEIAAEVGLDDATRRIRAATDGEVRLTPYEAIIVASLIEREAKLADEQAKVARVIYNRLAVGEPLGIDATTAYALGRPPVTGSDVRVDSPYNTRTNQGLPPGPIAVPGRAALEAALAPEPGEWFYYVLADENGRHVFTETAAEFEAAKAECRAKGLC